MRSKRSISMGRLKISEDISATKSAPLFLPTVELSANDGVVAGQVQVFGVGRHLVALWDEGVILFFGRGYHLLLCQSSGLFDRFTDQLPVSA